MFEVQRFGLDTDPQPFCQKSAVRVCQVATVVTESTQLVLSQIKNFLP